MIEQTRATYVYEIPASLGGGKLVLREVPLVEQQRLRRKHLGTKKASDIAFVELSDELTMTSLQGCSTELAAELGIAGDPQGDGLVRVSDSDGSRQQLWHRLSSKLRSVCAAAYADVHSIEEEVIAPLLASRQVRLE